MRCDLQNCCNLNLNNRAGCKQECRPPTWWRWQGRPLRPRVADWGLPRRTQDSPWDPTSTVSSEEVQQQILSQSEKNESDGEGSIWCSHRDVMYVFMDSRCILLMTLPPPSRPRRSRSTSRSSRTARIVVRHGLVSEDAESGAWMNLGAEMKDFRCDFDLI